MLILLRIIYLCQFGVALFTTLAPLTGRLISRMTLLFGYFFMYIFNTHSSKNVANV